MTKINKTRPSNILDFDNKIEEICKRVTDIIFTEIKGLVTAEIKDAFNKISAVTPAATPKAIKPKLAKKPKPIQPAQIVPMTPILVSVPHPDPTMEKSVSWFRQDNASGPNNDD